MASEDERVLDIKVRYSDAIAGIAEYKKKIEELKEAESQLKDEFKNGSISEEEYRKSMASSGETTKSYREVIRTLSSEVQNNVRQQNAQEGSLKSMRAELNNATRAYDNMSKAERDGAKGQELKKHINDITDKLKTAEEETQRYQRNVGNYEESIKSALGVNTNFANSIMSMSNNGKNIGAIFTGAADKAKAFGSTLLGMMGNPVFLSLAGIAGATVAFKWFYDYNKGLLQATRLTKEFLGLSGSSLQEMRNEVQATADTYGKDFKETLEGVDTITAQWGLNAKESLNVMNEGFQSGADLNGNMIAKIKQYAPAFKDAGLSAKQMVAIIQQTRSGIFTDKGMDLITMASKKIREMSKTTSESLDAIGISSKQVEKDLQSGSKSTFDVIQEISSKLKTMPQDSQAVGNVLKDVFGKQGASGGLQMIESLDKISTKLEDVKKKTGAWGENMDKQRKANAELNNTMAALFDMSQKGFGQMIANSKLFVTQGITTMLKGLITLINYFIDLYNNSMMFRAAIQAIVINFKSAWAVIKLVFNLIIDAAKNVGRSIKGIADIMEGIVTFSWTKIKNGFKEIGSNYVKTFKEGIGDVRNAGNEIGNAYLQGINSTIKKGKVAHIALPKYTDTGSSAQSNVVSGADTGSSSSNGSHTSSSSRNSSSSSSSSDKSRLDAIKKENEEIQKANDLLTELIGANVEKQRQIIANTYDKQISDVKIKLETEKNLTVKAKEAMNSQIISLEEIKKKKLAEYDDKRVEESIKTEQAYIETLMQSVKKGSEQEYQLTLQKIANQHNLELLELNQSTETEEEKGKQREAIEAKYNKIIEDAEKNHNEAINKEIVDAIKKRYENAITELQIKDNYNNSDDSELEQLRLKMEERKEILENAQKGEAESQEEFNTRRLALEKEYSESVNSYQKKQDEIRIAELKAVASVFSATSDLLSEFSSHSKTLTAAAKTLALANIAINTGVAIAEGVAAAAKTPFPANIAAIASTIAIVMSNITTAIKTVKSAKYATGGDVTGSGTGTSDSISAKLSNGESVLTAKATTMFAPALSAFNQIGGGVPIYGQGNNSELGSDYLAMAVAKGMMMAPQPVVSVEEINRVSNRVKAIERLGKI